MSQRERPVQVDGRAAQGEIPVTEETALCAGKLIVGSVSGNLSL